MNSIEYVYCEQRASRHRLTALDALTTAMSGDSRGWKFEIFVRIHMPHVPYSFCSIPSISICLFNVAAPCLRTNIGETHLRLNYITPDRSITCDKKKRSNLHDDHNRHSYTPQTTLSFFTSGLAKRVRSPPMCAIAKDAHVVNVWLYHLLALSRWLKKADFSTFGVLSLFFSLFYGTISGHLLITFMLIRRVATGAL